MVPRKYVACWLLCVIVPLGVAIVSARATWVFINTATKTNGNIVGLVQVRCGKGGRAVCYEPVFRFTAANGQSYKIRSNSSSNPPEFAVGQNVPVLYSPGNPAHARLNSTFQLWGVPIICASLGLFFSAFGCLAYWSIRRRRLAAAEIRPAFES